MKETRVAQRYAKSLISLAEERQVLEQVKEDMVIIKSVCEENRDFNNMLKSPVVKTDKKSKLDTRGDKSVCAQTTKNLLHSLL